MESKSPKSVSAESGNEHSEVLCPQINLDTVLRSKLGSKARFVPRFLVSWLKRLIHQDWINEFLRQEGDKQGAEWLCDCMKYINVTLDVHGLENLPAEDAAPCTFVSNHPLGGADGVALGSILATKYDNRIKYLVNDLLMNLPGLAPLCIPVNKTGGQSRSLPAMVKAGFSSTDHMLMFPAGLCSRLIDGKVQDLPWRKTFIQKSIETQRDIVPIHFGGENSPRFYRIARWCKRLGLKVNLAMAFLPDELYKANGKTFRIDIGKPIPWQTLTPDHTPAQWAEYVRNVVYGME